MVWYALEASRQATGEIPLLVIGHGGETVRQYVGEDAGFVLQEPQLGTGHAVLQAEDILSGKSDLVLVTYADMPLLTAETLTRLIQAHQERPDSPVTLLSVIEDDPRGFGRVVLSRKPRRRRSSCR
jgi:bifunctional UDP-N-acetylglucosamine pyrophosphorylase/glucosamine-1-phosphate N-acetyltransferase